MVWSSSVSIFELCHPIRVSETTAEVQFLGKYVGSMSTAFKKPGKLGFVFLTQLTISKCPLARTTRTHQVHISSVVQT